MYKYLFVVMFTILLGGCQHSARYDPIVKYEAFRLKKKTVFLLSKSNEPYKNYAKEIEEVEFEYGVAIDYASTIPKNKRTVIMWKDLTKVGGKIDGAFNLWKLQNTLNVKERKGVIEYVNLGFDKIIMFEDEKLIK